MDGANVGLYEQNFEKGGFSVSQVEQLELIISYFLYYIGFCLLDMTLIN